MSVVDPSAWLEYFADGANASFFAEPIEDIEALVVPTISLFEVFKRVLQQRGESAALQAMAAMQQETVNRCVPPPSRLPRRSSRGSSAAQYSRFPSREPIQSTARAPRRRP